jgi:hypothetical protein
MGVYSESGNLKVTVNDTTGVGRYAADGSIRVTLVTGEVYTGVNAPDGSMNVVKEDGSLYHPCGAVRGIIPYGGLGVYTPSGAFYLDGLDQSFENLEMEDGFNLLLETGEFILLE